MPRWLIKCYFWECLQGYLENRLAFELVNWQKTLPSPKWAGIFHSLQGPNRIRRRRQAEFTLSLWTGTSILSCSQTSRHWNFWYLGCQIQPGNYTIGLCLLCPWPSPLWFSGLQLNCIIGFPSSSTSMWQSVVFLGLNKLGIQVLLPTQTYTHTHIYPVHFLWKTLTDNNDLTLKAELKSFWI